MLANGNVLFTLRDAASHVVVLPKTESAQPPLAARNRMPDGRSREARDYDDGTDRRGERIEPRPAGRAASAAPEARQEIPDRQLERIRRATLIRPRAKMPPRL